MKIRRAALLIFLGAVIGVTTPVLADLGTVMDRIPLIYADAYNSPLTAKVEAKGNEIDFDLKRDAKGALKGNALRDTFVERTGPRLTNRPD